MNCFCPSCGRESEFRARRGSRLADQPCPHCGGQRTTAKPFRVRYRVTRPGLTWPRQLLCFTADEARLIAKNLAEDSMFGPHQILAVEQRTRTGWTALS